MALARGWENVENVAPNGTVEVAVKCARHSRQTCRNRGAAGNMAASTSVPTAVTPSQCS